MSALPIKIYIGYDEREAVAAKVLAHSIRSNTTAHVDIYFLEHRNLRQQGVFTRPWLINSQTGNYTDLVDNKPFSTQFSHTRFLVPSLEGFKGWALFLDCDMLWRTDVRKLFALVDDRYAVMCVKHQQNVKSNEIKMDNRPNESYPMKNWSSFVMFNCGHSANRSLTVDKVSVADGGWMHRFGWLDNPNLIGSLPTSYNYIPKVSNPLPINELDVIHYTFGGPWFDNQECKQVPLANLWIDAYEDYARDADHGAALQFPSVKYDRGL